MIKSELLSVPDGLCHFLAHVQPLHPLDLDMYPGQAHKVRDLPEGERTAPLDLIAVLAEEGGKLPLAVRSLPLGCFPRQDHLCLRVQNIQ